MSILPTYSNETLLLLGSLAILLIVIVVAVLLIRMRRSRTVAPPATTPSTAPSRTADDTPPLPTLTQEITLEFATAAGELAIFKLDKPVLTVGRGDDNDIIIAGTILNADTVSKHHARLRRDQDDYIVRDLGSRNGLLVNGRQTIENLLQDGDHLSFGKAEAVFHRPLAASAAPYQSESADGGAA